MAVVLAGSRRSEEGRTLGRNHVEQIVGEVWRDKCGDAAGASLIGCTVTASAIPLIAVIKLERGTRWSWNP